MNSYSQILETIFFEKYSDDVEEIPFKREEIEKAAKFCNTKIPKNVGDVVYSFRYRIASEKICNTAPSGYEWTIIGDGSSKFKFTLVPISRIIPNESLTVVKIPDATPEIITAYAQNDEQALLAKLRYNRLIDIFLGVTAFSLQNHLRTSVKGIGQIEIDEVYVAVDKLGAQYVIPVQAKGGKDKSGTVQTIQDYSWASIRLPQLVPRPVSAQFMKNNIIALFELTIQDGQVRIVDEKHYQLVENQQISREELSTYQHRAAILR